jgi:transposase
MRRVDCPRCGVTVEMVPWAAGKTAATHAFVWFLASWAKVLSWKETAKRFRTSWDTVFRCVAHAVQWGLAHRSLEGITAIGVDELAWKKRHKYLTLVYQLDPGARRLLYIARHRTAKSFNAFFDDVLGKERSERIVFVASDLWKGFLGVVRTRCSSALHVLDRFCVFRSTRPRVPLASGHPFRSTRPGSERSDGSRPRSERSDASSLCARLLSRQRGRLDDQPLVSLSSENSPSFG